MLHTHISQHQSLDPFATIKGVRHLYREFLRIGVGDVYRLHNLMLFSIFILTKVLFDVLYEMYDVYLTTYNKQIAE